MSDKDCRPYRYRPPSTYKGMVLADLVATPPLAVVLAIKGIWWCAAIMAVIFALAAFMWFVRGTS